MPAIDAHDPGLDTDPYQVAHPGPWYHATDQELEPGTVLIPGGGKSKWDAHYDGRGWEPRRDWVWMGKDPSDISYWGKHIYRVEPLDEGPWPWNGDGQEGFVAPRAAVIEKVNRPSGSPYAGQPLPNIPKRKSLSSNTIRCAPQVSRGYLRPT
jgi:hypothetical protein